ncbi:hypothetical protein [Pantoea dispersa]|uniref:hypothetical protein n=1 Tax=Pantoea dispersa TaxID=59814 RepID=UPI0021C7EFC2|nr:hypothetical protein [Pantoea dispersa]UXO69950.1 hypothetical protein N7977_08105 [Pantoea dispersa]
MPTKQEIHQRLDDLVSDAHKLACSLDLGDERIEAFELYEALRRLQRRGAASQMLTATNPLIAFGGDDEEEDGDWDEDD